MCLQSIFSPNMPTASSTLLILMKPCHETASLPLISVFRHKNTVPVGLSHTACVILLLPACRVGLIWRPVPWPGTWERGGRGRLYHHGSRREEMARRDPLRHTHARCNGRRCSSLRGIPNVVLNIMRVLELNMGRYHIQSTFFCVCGEGVSEWLSVETLEKSRRLWCEVLIKGGRTE